MRNSRAKIMTSIIIIKNSKNMYKSYQYDHISKVRVNSNMDTRTKQNNCIQVQRLFIKIQYRGDVVKSAKYVTQ